MNYLKNFHLKTPQTLELFSRINVPPVYINNNMHLSFLFDDISILYIDASGFLFTLSIKKLDNVRYLDK